MVDGVLLADLAVLALFGWGSRPPRDHPNYLSFEDGQLLSFNWVDGPEHLYNMSGPAAFTRALDFIDRWYPEKQILINCDQGQSRSPTVALLHLAKRLRTIPNTSLADAHSEFRKVYPSYDPAGIAAFVARHWDEIG